MIRLALAALVFCFGLSSALAEYRDARPRARLKERVVARKEGRGPKLLALSFTGGGIRGLVEVEVLARLEAKLKQKLGSDFQLREHVAAVAGTSAGAGNAAAYAKGKSIDEMRGAFAAGGKESVFPRTWRRFLSFAISKYSNKRLKKNIEHQFGKARLDDLKIPLLVPVWAESSKDYEGPRGVVFENLTSASTHGELPIADVLTATMAAPTYFPLVSGSGPLGGHLHADGALFNNDPTMTLAATLKAAARPHHERFLIGGDSALLSLGTGREAHRVNLANPPKWLPAFAKRWVVSFAQQRGILPWLTGRPSLIDAMIDGAGDVTHLQAKGVFGDAYRRIDPAIPNLPAIDDARAASRIKKFLDNDPAVEASIEKAASWVIRQLRLERSAPSVAN